MLKLHLTLLATFVSVALFAQEIDISKGWKFKKGDDMAWAKPELNDAEWNPIEVNRFWEFQGYNNYDGYAWYRKRVFIPSSLKQNSILKDSLKILLGIIDDHDQTFLNGELIGENGGKKFTFGNTINTPENSAYNVHRRYAIPSNHKAIRWDAENVIAIRVFDQIGNGGIGMAAKYGISMVDVADYLKIDFSKSPFQFRENGSFTKTIYVESNGPAEIVSYSGTLSIEVTSNISGQKLASYSVYATLSNNNPFAFEFVLPAFENTTAKYTFTDEKSKNGFSESQEVPFILTPFEKKEPKINGAKVFGARPGKPFLFKIAASGATPLVYSADKLPTGLSLDPQTGIITGYVKEKGIYLVKTTAKNTYGEAKSTLKIVIGDQMALTPAMGWNSWNCWGLAVSDEKVRSSAKAMVDKGLINYGWTYMNIDDGWESQRDAKGVLQPNEKFPDMKKLADDIHGMGLKLGIYSSPGPKTCGGYEGSYKYEQTDANTWAEWGIDYIKYDLCSYNDLPEMRKNLVYPKNGWVPTVKTPKDFAVVQAPYKTMQKALEKTNRDIYYSLCQYGIGEVWKWGKEVNAHSWRTTGDIEDTWQSMAGIGFGQADLYPYAKPGNWNDPDMLVVGKVGWGPKLRNSRLTVNEQYTHISLWSLLASPLLIGCDMAQLDDFTLGLLKNSEVIDINQDPAGKQSIRVINKPDYQIWVKEMEDGSKAVGIFNMSNETSNITLNFADIKLSGSKTVRDVWRQKDLGKFENTFQTTIASHGVALIKVF